MLQSADGVVGVHGGIRCLDTQRFDRKRGGKNNAKSLQFRANEPRISFTRSPETDDAVGSERFFGLDPEFGSRSKLFYGEPRVPPTILIVPLSFDF